jgi:hypothetical protein
MPIPGKSLPKRVVGRDYGAMRYHVLLDGSAGPDIELPEPPTPEEIVVHPEGFTFRVYRVVRAGWRRHSGNQRVSR